ncbi:MAG: metallophosphoesterase [Oscillospiraceae bacterium]|nr:metallophosphoesterase [Oscillospiraceae bacterium]
MRDKMRSLVAIVELIALVLMLGGCGRTPGIGEAAPNGNQGGFEDDAAFSNDGGTAGVDDSAGGDGTANVDGSAGDGTVSGDGSAGDGTADNAEAPSSEKVSFLFFSDTQPDPETGDFNGFGELLELALASVPIPDAVIFGGDTVNDGGDVEEWQRFWQAAGGRLDGLATAAVAGNHDNYPLLAEQFDYPSQAPGRQDNGFFYTLSLGPIFFIMLDSNAMGAANADDIEWLRGVLESNAARESDWIVAVMHHPMWPVADNPKDAQRAEAMREHFLPLLENAGVSLILCGHQHTYARSMPMAGDNNLGAEGGNGNGGVSSATSANGEGSGEANGGDATSANGEGSGAGSDASAANVGGSDAASVGIVQIMAASGDKATYSMAGYDYVDVGFPASNFVVLTASRDSLAVIAYDAANNEIDRFVLGDSHEAGQGGAVQNGNAGQGGDGHSSSAGQGATEQGGATQEGAGQSGAGSGYGTETGDEWRIRIVDTKGTELFSFTEEELSTAYPKQVDSFAHTYSTINNWPSVRFMVADGYDIIGILRVSGLLEKAQTVTFRGIDGYETSLTREQLLCARYYFPFAGESGDGAEPVMPVVAYRWRAGSTDLKDLREDRPMLVFGQSDPSEHTNPAFVEGLSEIVINEEPCDVWEAASTFPSPGLIAAGESVKLQHKYFGLVKIYYTIDGSDPTTASALYNPSTYQPELNVPIVVTESMKIRAIVVGYGKCDSEVAEFEFKVLE